jgi:hypothetical protein
VIAGTALLEMERAFDWPFFIADRGGDPLLWQHLFWFFGHPEVYIIFLPAAGMVSTMIPTIAGTPLVGRRAIIAALLGVGVFSFGLWAHHMFTAGLGVLEMSFVSAASMAVAVPTAIQVFAWIATLWKGTVQAGCAGAVPARLHVHLRAGRTDRRDGRRDPLRLAGARHLFHRRPPALRADRRDGVPGVRRHVLLAAAGQWQPPVGTAGALGVRADVRRLQRRLLPDAHHRPARHAAPRLHLCGRDGLERPEPGVDHRRLPVRRRRAAVRRRRGAHAAPARNAVGNPWNAPRWNGCRPRTTATAASRASAAHNPLWDQPELAREVEEGRHYLPHTATGRAKPSPPARSRPNRATCWCCRATAGCRCWAPSAPPPSSCC